MERSGRREFWCGLLLVLVVILGLNQTRLWRPELVGYSQTQITEAKAWWQGRLDLPERTWDTALKDGRVYSYFPPMFTIIAAGLVPLFNGVPGLFVVAMATVIPLCAYLLFHRLTRSAAWGAVLAIGYVCGTSAWPVLEATIRSTAPYYVNHTLASIGLLLILIDYFGGRRVWPAAVGLIIAVWSRQLTIVYVLPILHMAWSPGGGLSTARWKRVGVVAAACLLIVGVYGGLNTAKFGHPLRTGYQLNHEGRDDVFAREARTHGLLSARWVPRNLYHANLGFPDIHRITSEGEEHLYLRPNTRGTGIWWTTPLLLGFFFALPGVVRDRQARVLLLAAVLLYGVLMFWHATGEVQRGYNRYSLDYIPVIFALIAPWCIVGWRRWATLGVIAWSVVYFRIVPTLPHVELW